MDGYFSFVGFVGYDFYYLVVFYQEVFGMGFGQDGGIVFCNLVVQDVNEGVFYWFNWFVVMLLQGFNWYCYVGLIEFNFKVSQLFD